jgi:mRNA interferase RelE/StbE
MYKLVLEKTVLKFFEKHKWEKIIEIFRNKFELLAKNPYSDDLDIKAIVWEEDRYRLRVWKYRFLYEVDDKSIIIYVFDADSRGWIYK